jgi:hypothetical protein
MIAAGLEGMQPYKSVQRVTIGYILNQPLYGYCYLVEPTWHVQPRPLDYVIREAVLTQDLRLAATIQVIMERYEQEPTTSVPYEGQG